MSNAPLLIQTGHSESDNMAICRIKKPHLCFLPGDIIIGEIMDGNADNLHCWGYSSKFNRVVGGKNGYHIHYCNWKWLPRRWLITCDNLKIPRPNEQLYRTGAGHLFIVKWVQGIMLNHDYPHYLRNEAWLRRLLIELSCGNMPLTRREAAASPSTPFAGDRFPRPFRGRINYGSTP